MPDSLGYVRDGDESVYKAQPRTFIMLGNEANRGSFSRKSDVLYGRRGWIHQSLWCGSIPPLEKEHAHQSGQAHFECFHTTVNLTFDCDFVGCGI